MDFLTQPSTYALGLHTLVLGSYGIESLGWEPETIWHELQRTYGAEPSLLNRGKIQACRTVHVCDTPFTDWHVFEKVVVALNGLPVQFSMLQKPTPALLAYGVWALLKLRILLFSPEVQKYCAAILLDDGLIIPPEELAFCRPLLAPHVPPALADALRSPNISPEITPEDSAITLQQFRLRGISDYVTACRRLSDEHVHVAEALAAEVRG